jgi:hypothetical protein
LACRADEQKKFVETISYYLETGNSFDDLFEYMDTYFDQEIESQRHFMSIFLDCLNRYRKGTDQG